MEGFPFWRTCRVLANRPRLKLLGLVSRRPGLRVSELARAMKLSRPAASQYLRALEISGFLVSRRLHRSVVYGLGGGKSDPPGRALVRALIIRLGQGKDSLEVVFKLATAFANPGRIDVFRSLSTGAKSVAELKVATRWAARTLQRHLHRLETRGFVRRRPGANLYQIAKPTDEFGRALAGAAANQARQSLQTLT